MKKITFNETLFNSQKSYNERFCMSVNKVLQELKDALPQLTDAQVATFVEQPQELSLELEAVAAVQFNRYISTLPRSVQSSMQFRFTDDEIIRKLHKKLPLKPPLFTLNCCHIESGRCVFNVGELKEKCTIQGDNSLNDIWTLAQETAKNLNRLETLIKKKNCDWHALEDLRSFTFGLIKNTEDGYKPDPERLKQLS